MVREGGDEWSVEGLFVILNHLLRNIVIKKCILYLSMIFKSSNTH